MSSSPSPVPSLAVITPASYSVSAHARVVHRATVRTTASGVSLFEVFLMDSSCVAAPKRLTVFCKSPEVWAAFEPGAAVTVHGMKCDTNGSLSASSSVRVDRLAPGSPQAFKLPERFAGVKATVSRAMSEPLMLVAAVVVGSDQEPSESKNGKAFRRVWVSDESVTRKCVFVWGDTADALRSGDWRYLQQGDVAVLHGVRTKPDSDMLSAQAVISERVPGSGIARCPAGLQLRAAVSLGNISTTPEPAAHASTGPTVASLRVLKGSEDVGLTCETRAAATAVVFPASTSWYFRCKTCRVKLQAVGVDEECGYQCPRCSQSMSDPEDAALMLCVQLRDTTDTVSATAFSPVAEQLLGGHVTPMQFARMPEDVRQQFVDDAMAKRVWWDVAVRSQLRGSERKYVIVRASRPGDQRVTRPSASGGAAKSK